MIMGSVVGFLGEIYGRYCEISIAILMCVGMGVGVVVMEISGGGIRLSVREFVLGCIVSIEKEEIWMLLGLRII
ncbi:metal ABC transporter permease, partial [Siminovitchia fortis]|uniref:metal ABC transporter permease n=1 Tax=Siminovitchia fortis TaxID=254758 RepID=UPI0021B3695A